MNHREVVQAALDDACGGDKVELVRRLNLWRSEQGYPETELTSELRQVDRWRSSEKGHAPSASTLLGLLTIAGLLRDPGRSQVEGEVAEALADVADALRLVQERLTRVRLLLVELEQDQGPGAPAAGNGANDQ